MTVPPWFLYIAGFSLVLLGVLQVQARPRKPSESPFQRYVNVGTLWSACCVTFGVALVLMASGWWTPAILQGPKSPPRPHHATPSSRP